ncbi:MAG: ferredoxin [Candidatus Omnitrophica bacterium]|nr:ferredoxin [Candidatus Omnitrophota bacterium]
MRNTNELEHDAIKDVAEIMAESARTAPKTRGIYNIEVIAIDDDATKKKVIEKMREISKKENRPSFERDANSIEASPVFIVIGVKSNPAGLNCGSCGYATCAQLGKTKGICAYNSIDLGIAVGSAIGVASNFHADNRVMYSIGRACLDLKYFSQTVKQALGIPLSMTGKNPFFDRK